MPLAPATPSATLAVFPQVLMDRSMGLNSSDRILADFEHQTVGVCRIDQKVKAAAGADFYLIRKQANARFLHVFERSGNVVDMERQVVQTFLFLLDETQAALSHRDHYAAHAFILDFFFEDGETESFIQAPGLLDAADHNAYVVDVSHRCLLAAVVVLPVAARTGRGLFAGVPLDGLWSRCPGR